VSIVAAAALGAGLGVVTGMPLGVVNVAIVDAAAAGRRRFAIGVGIGGAAADTIHAALAFVGVGRVVTSRPELVRVLAIAAAALILGYVVVSWRRDRALPRPATDASSMLSGLTTGFALTLPNPGALAAWVAVAASIWPEATIAEALVLAVGVGLGSAVWFALLARWVSSVRPDHRALAIIPRIALAVLVVLAVVGVARVV